MSVETLTAQQLPWNEAATDLLYAPVDTEIGPVPAIELAERYYASPYATYMDDFQPPRFYTDFGYEPCRMIADLGQNVLPVGHQREVGNYVAWHLVRKREADGGYPFDPKEIGAVVFAALTHDSGETLEPSIIAETGVGVGDIPFGCKTPKQREDEAAIRAVVDRLVFPDVSPAVLARKELIISHQDDTALHDAYEAGHSLADFNTGLMAGSVALRELTLLSTEPEAMNHSFFEVKQLAKLFMAVVNDRDSTMLMSRYSPAAATN